MARNPNKEIEEDMDNPGISANTSNAPKVQVIEREINLALLNDKVNYMTGILLKIAEACKVDLSEN